MDVKKLSINKLSYNEDDGDDIDMSWFDELTPEEQDKELKRLKKSMFIKDETDK